MHATKQWFPEDAGLIRLLNVPRVYSHLLMMMRMRQSIFNSSLQSHLGHAILLPGQILSRRYKQMPSLRWKIFIILAFILFFFFGVVIGSQHYKPQKLNSFIKLFDLRNGKMLQVYDAYQGGRPSRTILYDKNNKNNYIDIWYNYDGSIDYFIKNDLENCIIVKYKNGLLFNETIIDRKNNRTTSMEYFHTDGEIIKKQVAPEQSFEWLKW